MADFDFSRRTEDDRLLLIAFTGGRPLSAGETADLLRALSSDYRQMTGRELVLAHYEVGSSWYWVTDAILIAGVIGNYIKGAGDFAGAIDNLSKFAKRIRNGLMHKPRLPVAEAVESGGVDKTLTAITKTAVKSGSHVIVRKITATETIEVEIGPSQAVVARDQIKRPKTGKKADFENPAVSYEAIVKPLRSLPTSSTELEAILTVIVNAHKAYGSTVVLERVADQLELEGRGDIASIIRRLLGRGGGTVVTQND